MTRATFQVELQKQNIHTVFRHNDQGYVFGLTFIDNKNKTVFNGSDLGKDYTAKGIMERLSHTDKPIKPELKTYLQPQKATNYLEQAQPTKIYLKPSEDYLESLLNGPRQDYTSASIPSKKRKRKKRTGMSL